MAEQRDLPGWPKKKLVTQCASIFLITASGQGGRNSGTKPGNGQPRLLVRTFFHVGQFHPRLPLSTSCSCSSK